MARLTSERLGDGYDAGCGRGLHGGFHGASGEDFGGAGGNKKNIVRLHGHVWGFRSQYFFEFYWSFRQTSRTSVNDSCTSQIRGVSCAPGQRVCLQDGEVRVVHQKAAWPSNITHHINQICFANDDCVAGQDGDVAFGVVADIARERNGDGFFWLIAMSDCDALACFFREPASGRNEIKKPLLAGYRINAWANDFA